MGMSAAGARGTHVSSINVTPMIDVLLVLLVVFMVLQPQLQRGLSVQVPPTEPGTPSADTDLVLEVERGGVYRLNRQPVAETRLRQELARVLEARNRRVLFVKAAEGVPYREVLGAVDTGRAAGASVVGLVPRSTSS